MLDEAEQKVIYRVAYNYIAMKRYEEALEMFKCLVLCDQENSAYLLGVGHALRCLERYQKAIDVLVLSLQITPRAKKNWFALAICQVALKQFDRAQESLYYLDDCDTFNNDKEEKSFTLLVNKIKKTVQINNKGSAL